MFVDLYFNCANASSYMLPCRAVSFRAMHHITSAHIQTNHRNDMMTLSNGNIFHVTGPLCGEFTDPGEFPTQRPVTRSFDVFFVLRLNKRLSKQPWGWWFETPSWSLWRQCNGFALRPAASAKLCTEFLYLISQNILNQVKSDGEKFWKVFSRETGIRPSVLKNREKYETASFHNGNEYGIIIDILTIVYIYRDWYFF